MTSIQTLKTPQFSSIKPSKTDKASKSTAEKRTDELSLTEKTNQLRQEIAEAQNVSTLNVASLKLSKINNVGTRAELAGLGILALSEIMKATEGTSKSDLKNSMYRDYKKRDYQQAQIAYALTDLLDSVVNANQDNKKMVEELKAKKVLPQWHDMIEVLALSNLEDRLMQGLSFKPQVQHRLQHTLNFIKETDSKVPEKKGIKEAVKQFLNKLKPEKPENGK